MVEPYDYRHKQGNSGVSLNNGGDITAIGFDTFNGGWYANQLCAVPRYIGAKGLRLASMNMFCTAGGDANVRVGIYAASGMKNLYPAGLLVDCGAQSMAAGGGKLYSPNITLTGPGVVWFAWLASTPNGQVVNPTAATPKQSAFTFLGRSEPVLSVHNVGVRVAQAYGALPATFPAGAVMMRNNDFPRPPFFFCQVF